MSLYQQFIIDSALFCEVRNGRECALKILLIIYHILNSRQKGINWGSKCPTNARAIELVSTKWTLLSELLEIVTFEITEGFFWKFYYEYLKSYPVGLFGSRFLKPFCCLLNERLFSQLNIVNFSLQIKVRSKLICFEPHFSFHRIATQKTPPGNFLNIYNVRLIKKKYLIWICFYWPLILTSCLLRSFLIWPR